MSARRRRANDFTDSIINYRQTLSDEETGQATSRASSETNERTLDSIRNTHDGYDQQGHFRNRSRASVILAGHLAAHPSTSSDTCNTAKKSYNTVNYSRFLTKDNISGTSDETSYYPFKPDLNKCINLFHNEHIITEYSLEEQSSTTLSETTASKDINSWCLSKNKAALQWDLGNIPRSMSADSLINIVLLNRGLRRSKSYATFDKALNRDTNYNIKTNEFSFPAKKVNRNSNEKIERIVPFFDALSLSKPLPIRKIDSHLTEDQNYDSVNNEESSGEELNPSELKTFLRLLAEQEPVKETATQQLRRMSANYYDSPKNFTERLITIVEESVVNNDSRAQCVDFSLSRFNKALRKTYKFIEDETVPEWPQSPGMSISMDARRKSFKSDLSRKSLGASASPSKARYVPVSPRHKIKSPMRIHRHRSKNTSCTMRNLDNTSTFENLEAYCQKLFPNEYKTRSVREKNESPLRKMTNILRTCENQMASLEDSDFDIHEQIKIAGACTSDSAAQQSKTPEMQTLQHRLPCEKYGRTDSRRVSDKFKHRTEYSKRELGILESSLMYEIVKKRQRCFDTAKALMEIDASSASAEVKRCPDIVINKVSPTKHDDEFMETLKCVNKYRNYLETQKPLLNLVHQASESSRTPRDKKDVGAKKNAGTLSTLLGNKPTLRTPKLSPRRKSTSTPSSAKHRFTSKTVVSKPRLFLTPEKKSLANLGAKPKRTYFPSMFPGTSKQNEHKLSPGANPIFQDLGNYKHVISPVALYIKGVDSNLIKKSRLKMDEKLTPRKRTTRTPSPKLKLGVSPRKEKLTGTTARDENGAGNFLQPKAHYKHPEEGSRKGENRK